MFKLIIILIAAITGLKQVESACNKCNAYGIACIDEHRFRICTDDGLDYDSTILECESGEICTDLGLVCVPKYTATAVPSCANLCGVCEFGNTFACTSRTTYALCKDGKMTNVTGSCLNSKVCDTSGSASVCVSLSAVNQLKCDVDATNNYKSSSNINMTSIQYN